MGEIAIEHVNEIEFDHTAYEKLVLSEDRKELIKGLVKN